MDIKPGKTLAILEGDLLCTYKTIKEPVYSASLPLGEPAIMHNHDGYELLLLLGGDINFYIGGYGRRLVPGDVICIKPYDFHICEMIDVNSYDRIVINIRDHLMETYSTDMTDLTKCFTQNGAFNIAHFEGEELERFCFCARSLQEALESDKYGADVLADTYIKQILVMVNSHIDEDPAEQKRSISLMPELVSSTIRYIDRHITDDITAESIAEHLHHNSTYVSRCFKKFAGISLQTYILNKKISLAQRYLKDQNMPGDVCFQVGFHNYSNFSRTFTKYTGMSPKKYQQKYAPEVYIP